MLNSITAHIKFIHGNHIFGEIVPYRIIYPKLPLYRFFRCKQISHLNVEFLPSLITDKIYFLILIFADRNMISAAEQFQIYNVFKRQINILCISSKHRFPDSMIRNIILFIGSKNLLALHFLTLHLIKQISITAIPDIIQNRLRRNRPLFTLKKLCKRRCRKCISDIGHYIGHDPLQ